jgi:hypothetical protein
MEKKMNLPNPAATIISEAAAPTYDYELKLNPLTRALYFSAGADVQLLKYCPNYDRVKLQGIGGTVIATAILAFISGSYAFYTIFGPNSPGRDDPLSLGWFTVAILVGLVWAAVIYNLDRFIVATTGHGDGTDSVTWGEVFKALPRFLMACLIGFVISKPLEIRIMKTEIDTRLEREQVALADDYMKDAAKRRDEQIDVITRAKQELAAQREKKSQELETLKLEWNKAEDVYQKESSGSGGSKQRGIGPIAEKMESLRNERKAAYEEGKARLQPEINELQNRQKERDGEADKAQQEYKDAEPKAKRQGEQLNGLIKRIEIAHDISPWASRFLTLMLIFIEVAPLIFKMMISLSPIDYLTENQKRLTLVRRGIEMSHELDGDGKLIQDVKKATYHQVDLEHLQVVGKIEIDHELTAAVQQKFQSEVVADIERNPSNYIERIQQKEPPKT